MSYMTIRISLLNATSQMYCLDFQRSNISLLKQLLTFFPHLDFHSNLFNILYFIRNNIAGCNTYLLVVNEFFYAFLFMNVNSSVKTLFVHSLSIRSLRSVKFFCPNVSKWCQYFCAWTGKYVHFIESMIFWIMVISSVPNFQMKTDT